MQFKTFDIVPHGTKIDFVGKRRIAVALSLLANLAVIVWALPWVHGLNYGVDFAGGTEMEVKFGTSVDPGRIRGAIEELNVDASVQAYGPASENSYLIRVERFSLLTQEKADAAAAAVKQKFPDVRHSFNPELGDQVDFEFKQVQDVEATKAAIREALAGTDVRVREVREAGQGLQAGSTAFTVITEGIQDQVRGALETKLQANKPEVRRVEYVGPAVGRELRTQGFKAILFAMALIVAYIGLRFDFRFSPGVIIAMLHDAVITLGYYAFTGREFNLTSIAVILTIVGYSVNDTVVIYDRIRENQAKLKGRSLSEIVNVSINETLGRTFLTSFATALSLVGLLVLGVGTIWDFAMAMMVGLVSGTYSTWFIAAPMTIWFEDRLARKKARAAGRHQQQAQPAPARTAAK
ncbi:MAG TPA: protein translocase subunit SecF [Anaeromyxobacter sp.]|nr:protein translocase subunit SecF [Anaeromyxobacter sp.]